MRTIYVIEGFDLVGKSHIANDIIDKVNKNGLETPMYYRPPYEKYDEIIGRDQAWILYGATYDLLDKMNPTDVCPIMDRSFVSFLVYTKLYNNAIVKDHDRIINDVIRKCHRFMDATHLHVVHESRETAEELYYYALKQNRRFDKGDKFESFDKYWERYLQVESLYEEFYKRLGINYTKIYNKLEV